MTYRKVPPATPGDLLDPDNQALEKALRRPEPACPRCGRLMLAGRCCEPIACPPDDGEITPEPQTRTTGVGAFFGTWPGEETEAELLVSLRAMDGGEE